MTEAQEIVGLINGLRSEEGSSVIINSQNADFNGRPNECIEVFDLMGKSFEVREDTLVLALRRAAVIQKERNAAYER